MLPLVNTLMVSQLFEEREHTFKASAGRICFPGGGKGKCADADFSLPQSVKLCEELGLVPENIKLCGALDALVTHTGPIIHPYVGIIDDMSKNPAIAKSEVERVLTVPLKTLLAMRRNVMLCGWLTILEKILFSV